MDFNPRWKGFQPMLKQLATRILSLMLVFSASPLLSQDLSQESDLVLRFTGPEAQKLSSFMKERVRLQSDFNQTRYYGDRMSLACREDSDCYLWLARKEWQADGRASSSILTFTLPVQQNTWSGRLVISPGLSSQQSQIQFQLQDLYYPGLYAFAAPMTCTRGRGTEEFTSLKKDRDCHLELSTSPKKGLPISPSIQVVENLDNIIVNFKGPWARNLFSSAASRDVDPNDPQRMRAQIGPETYCWNLDSLDQDKYLNDPYVCQTNMKRKSRTALQFVSQGTLKDDATFSLTLSPSFRHGIVQDLELILHRQGQEWTITHCPNFGKNAGFGQCGVLFDMKVDAGLYPLGNSVQGVAVGWGIIKKDPLE
jgi:hypothetical protein